MSASGIYVCMVLDFQRDDVGLIGPPRALFKNPAELAAISDWLLTLYLERFELAQTIDFGQSRQLQLRFNQLWAVHPLAKPDLVVAAGSVGDLPALPAWLSRLAGRPTVVFSGKSTSSTWSPSSFIAASKRTETAPAARAALR